MFFPHVIRIKKTGFGLIKNFQNRDSRCKTVVSVLFEFKIHLRANSSCSFNTKTCLKSFGRMWWYFAFNVERTHQNTIGNIVTLTDRRHIVIEQAHATDLSTLTDALRLSPGSYQEIPASKIILPTYRHKALYKNIKIYLATGLLARFIAATLRWCLNNILFHHNFKMSSRGMSQCNN